MTRIAGPQVRIDIHPTVLFFIPGGCGITRYNDDPTVTETGLSDMIYIYIELL